MDNPYKEGTLIYKDFNMLSDMQWHCTKCDLISGQAKTYEKMRDDGAKFYQNPKTKYYAEMIKCNICKRNTMHRKFI